MRLWIRLKNPLYSAESLCGTDPVSNSCNDLSNQLSSQNARARFNSGTSTPNPGMIVGPLWGILIPACLRSALKLSLSTFRCPFRCGGLSRFQNSWASVRPCAYLKPLRDPLQRHCRMLSPMRSLMSQAGLQAPFELGVVPQAPDPRQGHLPDLAK